MEFYLTYSHPKKKGKSDCLLTVLRPGGDSQNKTEAITLRSALFFFQNLYQVSTQNNFSQIAREMYDVNGKYIRLTLQSDVSSWSNDKKIDVLSDK